MFGYWVIFKIHLFMLHPVRLKWLSIYVYVGLTLKSKLTWVPEVVVKYMCELWTIFKIKIILCEVYVWVLRNLENKYIHLCYTL